MNISEIFDQQHCSFIEISEIFDQQYCNFIIPKTFDQQHCYNNGMISSIMGHSLIVVALI